MVNNPNGSYYTNDPFIDTYAMCMNMKLPITYSVTFERKFLRQEINWDVPIFKKEKPPKKGLWSAYTATCSEDSGSPQMLFAITPKESKFVLAAVHSRSVGHFYNKTSNTFYPAPCGTHTNNTEKNHPNQENILRDISISLKITYGPILEWIKSQL